MNVINLVRAAKRGTFVTGHLFLGILAASLLRLRLGAHWYASDYGRHVFQWWMQHMARLMGIRIIQYGIPPAHHALYVANHISFIDVIIIAAATPTSFLSKNSVRHWPLIGYLSAISGVIFIKRGKRNMIARIIDTITESLKEGRSVMAFPEGTTSLGRDTRKFHSGLFQAAINSQSPVQAIALRYLKDNELDRTAAYIENDNFLISLYRIIKRPETIAHVKFCPINASEGFDRTTLAHHTRQQVMEALAEEYVASH